MARNPTRECTFEQGAPHSLSNWAGDLTSAGSNPACPEPGLRLREEIFKVAAVEPLAAQVNALVDFSRAWSRP